MFVPLSLFCLATEGICIDIFCWLCILVHIGYIRIVDVNMHADGDLRNVSFKLGSC